MGKKGQCISPLATAPEGWFYTGILCDKTSKCKCYQECKNPKCAKLKGLCLITATNEIPFGYKKKGICNKKAKCDCYVPICAPNAACAKKGGQCFGNGMKVPNGAKYLGWCSKPKKCKCYKVPTYSRKSTQIEIPSTFNANGEENGFCLDTDRILLMSDKTGQVEGYKTSGPCGLNSIASTGGAHTGGGLAYAGERLIAFGGWKGGFGQNHTFEYDFNTNTWTKIDDMVDGGAYTSYYAYTQSAIGTTISDVEVVYYFASPQLYIFNPATTGNPWSLKMTNINLWTKGVVGVGHYLIIIDGKTGSVIKYNPDTNSQTSLTSLPIEENRCYYPKAAVLKRSSGVGIMAVCSNGDTWFCLLDKLESTPSLWTKLAIVDPQTTSGTMLAYVEGAMYCLRGPNAWKWDDAGQTWTSAPGGYSAHAQNYARTTYTSIPRDLLPGC